MSDVRVRPCADEAEFERALLQIGQYFGSDSSESWGGRFARVAPLDRMLGAWDGDTMIGGTGAMPFRLSVPGGSIACCGTTTVGVAPTHRRRGVLRALMRRHLDDAHERGEPIAALWASDEGIYGRFGYGRAAFTGEISVPREHAQFDAPIATGGEWRLLDTDEALEAFPPLWEAAARIRPGMILRTREWWEDRALSDPTERRWGGGPKRLALLERDGTAAGYAIYRHRFGYDHGSSTTTLEVVEDIGVDAAADRVGVAVPARHRLDGRNHRVAAAARPSALLPAAAAEAHEVPHGRRPVGAARRRGRGTRGPDATRRTAGSSSRCATRCARGTTGRWGLDGERTEAAADIALDASTLGAAYLGGIRLASLAQGGRVEELTPGAIDRADGILRHGLHPWCPEIF